MSGLAFLRKGHGGGKSPPDTCQEPPFESISLGTDTSVVFILLYHMKFPLKSPANHENYKKEDCCKTFILQRSLLMPVNYQSSSSLETSTVSSHW